MRTAVVMLGFNSVRNAIFTVAVIDAFGTRGLLKDFDITDFWRHALAVAVTDKSISLKTCINSPDNCFVGGLIHDVGKVVLAQYFPHLFAQVWRTLQEECCSFLQAEQRILPAAHPLHGAHLAAKWQLPQGLVDAILWHHADQPRSENSEFVTVIYLADIIVNGFQEDPECLINLDSLQPDARKLLLVCMENAGEWYAGIAGEIEAAQSFFLEAA